MFYAIRWSFRAAFIGSVFLCGLLTAGYVGETLGKGICAINDPMSPLREEAVANLLALWHSIASLFSEFPWSIPSVIAGGISWALAQKGIRVTVEFFKPAELSPMARDFLKKLEESEKWKLEGLKFITRDNLSVYGDELHVDNKNISHHLTRKEKVAICKRAIEVEQERREELRQQERAKLLRSIRGNGDVTMFPVAEEFHA